MKKVLEGDKDSQEYLVDILSEENDKVFVDTLGELLHYDEFKDFIYSEEDKSLEVGALYVWSFNFKPLFKNRELR